MKKIYIILCILFLYLISFKIDFQAAYNYDPKGNVISSAEALVAVNSIDASNLVDKDNNLVSSLYSFGKLTDVATDNELIYLCDSTNNKIWVLDHNYTFVKLFPEDALLNNPQGLYITDKYIYICDYGNNEIKIFDKEFNLVNSITAPTDKVFEKYEFRPKKICVSRTGRMYVIAEGINEGIIDFNADGTFSRFYGMNRTTLSAWKAFWQLFTTEEQRAQQGYNFGSSLLNLCVDKDEYVYAVSSPNVGKDFIKKLNYKGTDVLNRNGYIPPDGDVVKTSDKDNNKSTFVDIDVDDDGNYIVLDRTRGRIFAYDKDGDLLYTGGSLATTVDSSVSNLTYTFQFPEALCYYKNQILVVDSKNMNLTVFSYTTFGSLVNDAVKDYNNNDYESAALKWEEILELNSNYYLAYAGIGRAELRKGNYKEALEYLKISNDSYNYSQAYKQYRAERLTNTMPYIIGAFLIIIVVGLSYSFVKNIKGKEKKNE